MSDGWPYARISLQMEAKGGSVAYYLCASGGEPGIDSPFPLADDAPDHYTEYYAAMRERNPDMTDEQIHHRVLMNWWEAMGGATHP